MYGLMLCYVYLFVLLSIFLFSVKFISRISIYIDLPHSYHTLICNSVSSFVFVFFQYKLQLINYAKRNLCIHMQVHLLNKSRQVV